MPSWKIPLQDFGCYKRGAPANDEPLTAGRTPERRMARLSSDKFHAAFKAYNDDRLDDAMRLMEECAREDDPVACFTMAIWHRETESPEALRRSACWLKRLEQLAEEGNARAQWELGQQFRFGNLLPYDVDRANYWL